MIEKRYSSAIKQYNEHVKKLSKATIELNKTLATFFLKIPIGINYELWKYLHEVKGEWIE